MAGWTGPAALAIAIPLLASVSAAPGASYWRPPPATEAASLPVQAVVRGPVATFDVQYALSAAVVESCRPCPTAIEAGTTLDTLIWPN